jgi:two-component system sensor histidine kinase UhpB
MPTFRALLDFAQFANEVVDAIRDLRNEDDIITTIDGLFARAAHCQGGIGFAAAEAAGATPDRARGDSVNVPLIVGGAVAGRLTVSFLPPGVDFVPLIHNLAEHISIAIERAREDAERERLTEALRRTEERSRVLSETMSDFVYALRAEPDGTLRRDWTAGDIRRLTGYTLEEMDGRGGVLSIVHPDDRAIVMRRAFALAANQPYMDEYRIIHKDGRVRWIRYYTHPLRGEGHESDVRIYGAAQDITEARESEMALRESEEKYRSLVESISEVIYEIDEHSMLSYVSPAIEALLGYQPEELEGRHFREFVDEEDALRVVRDFRDALGRPGRGAEYRVRTKSGETRWVRTNTQPIYQGEQLAGVRGVLVDVTERVRADERLRAYQDHLEHLVGQRTAELRAANERLATLSKRLMHAQEDQRRAIARELHDEIGQALTALRISLQAARRAHPVPAPQLNDGIRIAEQTLHQVRDLSLDLRPSLLDDLGLVPALRWYIDRQAQRTGLAIVFEADAPEERLPADLEIACFRFVQEALTNVARHAQASQVRVRLQRLEPGLALEVADDGVGFDVADTLDEAAHGGSIGLLGMRERVQLAGGHMEIESREGKGSLVRARFPMRPFAARARTPQEDSA